jgi:predicted ester cyclase
VSAGKALYRRWINEVWTRGDVGLLDELHIPALADRTGLPGVTPETAGMKQFILRFRTGFPAVFTIEDVVAEGDRIAGRWTMRGTHTGEFNGIPATGRPVTLAGFSLLRIQDGQVGELWHLEDDLSALQQLGIIPGSG